MAVQHPSQFKTSPVMALMFSCKTLEKLSRELKAFMFSQVVQSFLSFDHVWCAWLFPRSLKHVLLYWCTVDRSVSISFYRRFLKGSLVLLALGSKLVTLYSHERLLTYMKFHIILKSGQCWWWCHQHTLEYGWGYNPGCLLCWALKWRRCDSCQSFNS